jgi:hypothetical protein
MLDLLGLWQGMSKELLVSGSSPFSPQSHLLPICLLSFGLWVCYLLFFAYIILDKLLSETPCLYVCNDFSPLLSLPRYVFAWGEGPQPLKTLWFAAPTSLASESQPLFCQYDLSLPITSTNPHHQVVM